MNGRLPLALVFAAALCPLCAYARHHGSDGRAPSVADLDAKDVAVDSETPIPSSREKAIESYRAFLDLPSKNPALTAEAMRRLADLELEAGEADELGHNAEFPEDSFGSAIELYKRLLSSYPNYTKNDLVLYQLARAYEAEARPKEALAALDRLVNEYPHTPHFDEAEFRRGEMLFVNGRYVEAEAAYAEVLAHGQSSPFYEQSLYKHGWSLFKQQQNQEALDSFLGVLDLELGMSSEVDSAAAYAALGRADQELVNDSFRVLSISFSYLDGPRSIAKWLKAHGARPYAYMIYSKLGDLYLEKERYQDAADAYRSFADAQPFDAKAPLLETEAINAYEKGRFPDLVLRGKRTFVERYGAGSPYWRRYSFADQPQVAAELESDLSDLAAYHHARAQKTHDLAEYAAAADWYRAYLKSFPQSVEAASKNFLLAEALFESGRYHDAALEYERSAYAYPSSAKSSEAGYAALLAYKRYEDSLSVGAERDAWQRRSIESALKFADAFPQHPQAAAAETDAAEQLYALGDLDAARTAAMQVVQLSPAPTPKLERSAWSVIAHADFAAGQYAEAEKAYTQLGALVPAADAEHKEVLAGLASSIYKQGEEAVKQGKDKDAVEHFLRVGRAASGSSIVPTAEYDAAAALIRLKDWPRAAAVLEDFRRQFPKNALAADATAKLAVAYFESGDKARAAREFARIAEGKGAPDAKRDALWRAADLYSQTGNESASAGAFSRYVERYPHPAAQAIEARQRLVQLAEKAGDRMAETRWLNAVIAADGAAGAERTDRTRYLAAEAQLTLAAQPRDAFLGVKLVVPLKKSLETKGKLMQKALAAYGRAADYGVDEVTTAATYEIAELYHAMARGLEKSERPAGLGADALEQYQILLEEQADPFVDKAIQAYEVNAARAADGVYDEWVRKSFAALAELVPARYAKPEMGERLVSAIR
ncbi:MAG TPA: tetratricopeptide repeat protein [Gammaproteobacteria bacterium]|nr:tetratricopeptide repeat protein [Gammaproteobacteria bacterium]